MVLLKYLMRKLKNAWMRRRIHQLRKRGILIGENTLIYKAAFDYQFPYLITVGVGCVITNGCVILAHDASVVMHLKKTRVGRVNIGNHVFLGINTIVLPGVTIGDDVVVGVGSVVTSDVPPRSVVAGVPARVVCSLDDYLAKQDGRSDHTYLVGPWGIQVNFEEEQALHATVRSLLNGEKPPQ